MKPLQIEFDGTGEVRGMHFKQIKSSNKAYIYEIYDESTSNHYEVFLHRENTRFGTISYPKSNNFGIWAWSCSTLKRALQKFDEISIQYKKQ
jgi:hypothetical protein